MKSQKAKEFIDGCMAHLTVEMSGPEIRQIGFIREPTGEIEDEDNE